MSPFVVKARLNFAFAAADTKLPSPLSAESAVPRRSWTSFSAIRRNYPLYFAADSENVGSLSQPTRQHVEFILQYPERHEVPELPPYVLHR